MSGDAHHTEPSEGAGADGGEPDLRGHEGDHIDLTVGAGSPADGTGGAVGGGDESGDDGIGTRERIVAAAAEVFLQKGFTGTRVVDIARRAGFTPGALYGHFDSRAELLAEAVARGSSQMLSRLLGAGAGVTAGADGDGILSDPLTVLRSALDQIAGPIDETDQMLLDGIALAHREPVTGDRLAGAVDQFRAELASSTAGGLGKDAADMLVVIVLGVTAARALGWHDPPSDDMRRHMEDCITRASARAPEHAVDRGSEGDPGAPPS